MSSYLNGHRPADMPVSGFMADACQDEANLVAGTAPSIKVSSEDFRGTVWSMPIRAYLGDGQHIGTTKMQRAPGAKFPRPMNDFEPTETAYKCQERSAADFIDAVTARRFKDVPYGAEQWKAGTLRWLLKLDYEAVVIADGVFATGNWTDQAVGALGGASAQLAWTNLASTPKTDGRRMRDLIRTASGGITPDYGYITYAAVEACCRHPDFTGHVGTYAQGFAPGAPWVSPQDVIAQMKAAWSLSELHVVQAMYNSANPGQAVTVAEIESGGQLWMGCKRGMGGAAGAGQGVVNGAQVGLGPVSFLVVKEDLSKIPGMEGVGSGDFAGFRWESNDPPGTDIAGASSFAFVMPSDMSVTANLCTGLT